jgi:hypothetical protein
VLQGYKTRFYISLFKAMHEQKNEFLFKALTLKRHAKKSIKKSAEKIK